MIFVKCSRAEPLLHFAGRRQGPAKIVKVVIIATRIDHNNPVLLACSVQSLDPRELIPEERGFPKSRHSDVEPNIEKLRIVPKRVFRTAAVLWHWTRLRLRLRRLLSSSLRVGGGASNRRRHVLREEPR